MVGSAIVRRLATHSNHEVITADRQKLDLTNQSAVFSFLENGEFDMVIDGAARVGGILANRDYPYQFISDNLCIQDNLIRGSVQASIKNFIFLGSSCIYPKEAPQPIIEESLLTGPLEPTNQWYAVAKISGVKSCEAVTEQYGYRYLSLMPTNLYGTNDNFDVNTSHVLPAMIRKFHDAKVNNHKPVELWGSGSPMREFLHVDDLARAVHFAMGAEMSETLYNVGYGSDVTIKELARIIQSIVGHEGEVIWDSSKPDGTMRKLMNSNRFRSLGWEPSIDLEQGVKETYDWFQAHINEVKEVKITG